LMFRLQDACREAFFAIHHDNRGNENIRDDNLSKARKEIERALKTLDDLLEKEADSR